MVLRKDREAWYAAVHGVAKSQTRLCDWTTTTTTYEWNSGREDKKLNWNCAKFTLWNWTFSVTTLSCKFISTEDKSICYPNWNMLFKWFDDLFYHDVYFFPHTCKQFSNTSWVCYNLVHNNTIYLKQLQIPEDKGLVPQTCHPPHFRSLSQIHLTMHFWSNH